MGCAAASSVFHEWYILQAKVIEGTFAQVHLAKRVHDDEEVAVKITDLRGAHGGQMYEQARVDPMKLQAVNTEVAILKRFGASPRLLGFHEVFIEGHLSYVVMERCDTTLWQAMERTPELTERTVARFVREMLQALSTIHSVGVVHRDVKPDSFLCSGEERTVKLCDFGFSEVVPGVEDKLRDVRGTAPFMSPEMLGEQGYGTKTDVWSLGVTAYLLLLGVFPYHLREGSPEAFRAAILAGAPPPTFRPVADSCVPPPSLEAVAFLVNLLDRTKAGRPSAEAALRLEWMGPRGGGQRRRNAPSFRPTLCAAKSALARDARAPEDGRPRSLDVALAALQAKHGGLSQPAGNGASQEAGGLWLSSRRLPGISARPGVLECGSGGSTASGQLDFVPEQAQQVCDRAMEELLPTARTGRALFRDAFESGNGRPCPGASMEDTLRLVAQCSWKTF